jgi:hypothetical protein
MLFCFVSAITILIMQLASGTGVKLIMPPLAAVADRAMIAFVREFSAHNALVHTKPVDDGSLSARASVPNETTPMATPLAMQVPLEQQRKLPRGAERSPSPAVSILRGASPGPSDISASRSHTPSSIPLPPVSVTTPAFSAIPHPADLPQHQPGQAQGLMIPVERMTVTATGLEVALLDVVTLATAGALPGLPLLAVGDLSALTEPDSSLSRLSVPPQAGNPLLLPVVDATDGSFAAPAATAAFRLLRSGTAGGSIDSPLGAAFRPLAPVQTALDITLGGAVELQVRHPYHHSRIQLVSNPTCRRAWPTLSPCNV